jgi:hypothetical protein
MENADAVAPNVGLQSADATKFRVKHCAQIKRVGEGSR